MCGGAHRAVQILGCARGTAGAVSRRVVVPIKLSTCLSAPPLQSGSIRFHPVFSLCSISVHAPELLAHKPRDH